MKLKNYSKLIGCILIVGYITMLFVTSIDIKNVKKEPTLNEKLNTNEGGVRVPASNKNLEVQPIPVPNPNIQIKIKPL